jgi:hypothetical protein
MLTKGASKAALDAVPAAARNDIGYKFARIQLLRRADELAEAVALIKTIPQLDRSHDLDEWWMERRVLARKLLDDGNAKDAYAVVRDATPPDSPNYRSEHQFMAGWIALRFLHDPSTAYAHLAKIAESAENPISIARGAYWTGRAAEALHKNQEAKQRYQEAARYPTAYYGQIARAKAGLGELVGAAKHLDTRKLVANVVAGCGRDGVEHGLARALLDGGAARPGDHNLVAPKPLRRTDTCFGVVFLVEAAIHARLVVGARQHFAEGLVHLAFDILRESVVAPRIAYQFLGALAVAADRERPRLGELALGREWRPLREVRRNPSGVGTI